jgi:hypothetical protein
LASWVNLILNANKIREFKAANNIVRGAANIASPPPRLLVNPLNKCRLGAVCLLLLYLDSDCLSHRVQGVCAHLTQAGCNPARDFGPRMIAGSAECKGIAFHGWWVYVIAPIIGAPIGAFVADKFLNGR